MVKEAIKRKISPGLLEACIALAERGQVNTTVYAFNTHYTADYSDLRGLKIHFEDGSNSQGDGEVQVSVDGKLVLYASPYYFKDKQTVEVVTPPLKINRPFAVDTYVPGNWERRVIAGAKK